MFFRSYWPRVSQNCGLLKHDPFNLLLRTECPPGFHGPGCSMRCSCHPDATCDPQTGHCVCPPGKQGHDCATCKNYTYKNHNVLHFSLGFWEMTMLEWQTTIWHNCRGSGTLNISKPCAQPTLQYLRIFTACESGYWGQGCLSKCQCREISVGCDPVTGQCACEAGFTGDHCENSKSALFQKINAAT